MVFSPLKTVIKSSFLEDVALSSIAKPVVHKYNYEGQDRADFERVLGSLKRVEVSDVSL